MKFRLIGHEYQYETRNIVGLFFPGVKIEIVKGEDAGEDELVTQLTGNTAIAKWNFGQVQEERSFPVTDGQEELWLCRALYELLRSQTGITPPWGMLTGVRPVKQVIKGKQEGKDDETIIADLMEMYGAGEKKLRLCMETYYGEEKIHALSRPDGYSLYVSIPFCPTRCSYCSFVSHAIETAQQYMDEYVDNLCSEIAYTGKIMGELGKKLQTIYIGGGTPTAVTASHLERITQALRQSFSFDHLLEYTCEAGRADTITKEKLQVLKDAGVSRISINPQTMNDDVLRSIGRRHTAEDFMRCYQMAAEMGFDAINTDLIAGLTGESVESFRHTVDTMVRLNPENVTVHALTVKRAADLGQIAADVSDAVAQDVAEMVEYAYDRMKAAGYLPYYMYRQKNTKGNLENVGYAKPGKEGIYNVLIMAEIQSIIAVGAGASTKLVDGERMQRIFNYKFPFEYTRHPEEWRRRKEEIVHFFRQK